MNQRWSRAVLVWSAIAVCLACVPAMVYGQAEGAHPLSMATVSAGAFDPSIADTPPGQKAWMSYSAVNPSPRWPEKNVRTITTRLAYSDDAGRTWNDFGSVNPLTEVDMGSGKGGSWNSEVSSLVFDPWAPRDQRWKLFWHHYLIVGTAGQYANGWIGYKTAATPEGLLSAPEVKLFGAFAYKHENDRMNGPTGSPVAGPPAVDVGKLDPSLKMCVALSEPGVMATRSGLYMAVDCYSPKVKNVIGLLGMGVFGGPERKIVLLKCDGPPELQSSWRYIATLLTASDAESFGKNSFTGSDLFSANGHAYLIASPVSNKPWKNAYNGCYVFRFADLATGTLERENGHPVALMKVHGNPDSFNGACTYQASVANAGFVFGQVTTAGRPVFHVFTTGPLEREVR